MVSLFQDIGDAGDENEGVLDDSVSHDPGEWPAFITDNIRQLLVQRGPEQVTQIDFPLNSENRRFSTVHYRRQLNNGELIHRPWLIYSVKKNVVFCFCCRLFSQSKQITTLNSEVGNCDWRHLARVLSEHETSPRHMRAFQDWDECNKRIRTHKTIDRENQKMIESEAERWREVLKRIVLMVEFLASQNLAFRGKSDTLYDRNNGNFLKIMEFISKFDSVTAEHLRRINSKEVFVSYLGKGIQNEIINLLGLKIKQLILKEIKDSKYYSIILDCTPDVSHTEQLTLTVRYVYCGPESTPTIKESFLGFIPIDCSTGEALTDTLLKQLEALDLPLNDMRGQGYDNGANVKGKHAGVQKRILDVNPRAFFVPCSAHTLNLVVNDAALSCIDAVNFFGTVQELYNFFCASTHRWTVLQNYVSSLTLKPLSETRWESRIDAVSPLRYQAGEVYDALLDISADTRTDAFGKNAALSLAKKLKNYKFICSLLTWHTILFRVNLVSKLLQRKELDITKAIELIGQITEYFIKLRTDKGFEETLVDAREVAETLEIEPTFEKEEQLRPRRKKKQFDYESSDEPTTDPKIAFKRDFYFYVLDRATSSLQERFEQLRHHQNLFGFMYNAFDYDEIQQEEKKEDLKKKCAELQIALTDGSHSDIDGNQLFQELLILTSIKTKGRPLKDLMDILNYLTSSSLCENFPNLCVALRIGLTLPVTVASGERSFSKLKLIKNYLRSTMSQERLVGLALVSIEFDVLQNIKIDELIKDFSETKARRVFF